MSSRFQRLTSLVLSASAFFLFIFAPASAFASDITWTANSLASHATHPWYAVASSADGVHLAAVEHPGNIFTSADSGATWTLAAGAGNQTWSYITSSSDGSHLAALAYTGDIWTSTDSGATWTDQTQPGSGHWYSVASSASGENLVAVQYGGDIWTSIDGGDNWTDQTQPGSQSWAAVTSDSTGMNLAAAVDGGDIWTSTDGGDNWVDQMQPGSGTWDAITSDTSGLRLAAAQYDSGDIWTSIDGGDNWVDQMQPGAQNWYGITSSSDGTELAAIGNGGDIWTSVDGGDNWVDQPQPGAHNWYAIASSADDTDSGTFLIAAENNGELWTSSNGGVDWVNPAIGGPNDFTSVTSSANGTRLAAVIQGGDIWTSDDGGATWTDQTLAGSRGWIAIASDSTGMNLAAAEDGGDIWTSVDGGVNWTDQASGSRLWSAIASDSTGMNLAATVSGGKIYTSTDSGVSWFPSNTNRAWNSITSDSTGMDLAATVANGRVYTSTNAGGSWVTQTALGIRAWSSITSSADGQKIAAAVNGGDIYISLDGGSFWNNFASIGTHGWTSIASSADGTTLAAVDGTPGEIYISTGRDPNTSDNWIDQVSAGSQSWRTIAMSADGKTFVAAVNPGALYVGSSATPILPTLTTSSVLSLAPASVTAEGVITDNGNEDAIITGFVYGADDTYGATTTENASYPITYPVGAFAARITGLTCDTEYHYAAYASNSAGTSYGNDVTFTTLPCVSSPAVPSYLSTDTAAAGVPGEVDQTVDADGNVYVTGVFSDSVDFDPTGAPDVHVSAGGTDIYLTKYDPNGVYEWTKTFGGTGDDDFCDYAKCLTTDADGNVYLAGHYSDTVNFDPDGTDNRASNGGTDAFVTSFSPDGTRRWTNTFGGSDDDQVCSNPYFDSGKASTKCITVDTSGNVYLIGSFKDTVNFDPTGGTDDHTALIDTDFFLTSYASDGSYRYTNTVGADQPDAGGGGTERADSVATDADGHVYVAGIYDDFTIDFDPSTGTDFKHSDLNDEYSLFLTSYNTDGSYRWTDTYGDPSNVSTLYTGAPFTLALDHAGNPYLFGHENGMDLDPSAGIDLRDPGYFITSVDGNGNYRWTTTIPDGISICESYTGCLAFDSNDNLYLTDTFSGTVDFNPSGGGDSRTSNGGQDVFITSYANDGTYRWTHTFGGTSDDFSCYYSSCLAIDGADNIYFTGEFQDSADFDQDGSGDIHTSNGSYDVFLTAYHPDGSYWFTKTVGGTGDDEAYTPLLGKELHIDGYFNDSVDFNPDAGTDTHVAQGSSDFFLMNFSPPPAPPAVTTQSASGIGMTDVTGHGTITDMGSTAPTVRGFVYGLDDTYGATTTDSGIFAAGSYTESITSLTCGTQYHYAAYATNVVGTSYGNDVTFTTSDCPAPPTVTTQAASAVDQTSATGHGNITNTGGDDPTVRGFVYGTSADYTATTTESGDFGIGSFTGSITSLTCGTEYHYAAYATNVTGTGYGGDHTFITDDCSGGGTDISCVDPTAPTTPGVNAPPTVVTGDYYNWTNTGTLQNNTTDVDVHPISDTAVDPHGNVYTVGDFAGTADFDPSAGVDTHTSTNGGSDRNVYLSKFAFDGTYEWTKTFGGQGGIGNNGWSVQTDSVGNIYIAGDFTGTADFDPGAGVDDHTSSSAGADINSYLTKLDPDGNYLWAKTWGSHTAGPQDLAWGLAVDPSDNVYVLGFFGSTVDFDPSAGVDNHTAVSANRDTSVTKYDSSGTYEWTNTFGNSDSNEDGSSITTDSSGDVYVTGLFRNTMDFDPSGGVDDHTSYDSGVPNSHPAFSVFLTKYDTNGGYLWTNTLTGQTGPTISGSNSTNATSVITDPAGHVYISGEFSTAAADAIDFNPGSGVDDHTATGGGGDAFVSSYNSDGSYRWTNQTSGDGDYEDSFGYGASQNLAISSAGILYFSGIFDDGPVDFDPGPGTDNFSTDGGSAQNIFVTSYDTAGAYQSTKVFGGTDGEGDEGTSLSLFQDRLYIASSMESDSVDFDPSAGTDIHTLPGDDDEDYFLSSWTLPNYLGPDEFVSGGHTSNVTPTLTFTPWDPEGSDTSWEIQIDDSADFGSPVVDYTSELGASGPTSFTVGQAVIGGGLYIVGSPGQTLAPGSYYWRVVATDDQSLTGEFGTANCGAVAFILDAPPPTPIAPTITTQAASSIAQTSVTGNGTITDTGGDDPTVRGFVYGADSTYGATTTENGTFDVGSFTGSLDSLTCGTQYHYAAYATNGEGTGYGNDLTFVTNSCGGGGGGTPSLTLDNIVINTAGGTNVESDWTLTATGPTTISGPGASGSPDVESDGSFQPGTYTFSYSGPSGYTSHWSCDGILEESITDNGNGTITFPIQSGDDIACTLTNSDSTGTLNVTTHVINSHGAAKTAANFTVTVTNSINPDPFQGSELGTSVTLNGGAYSADVNSIAGYSEVSNDCSGTMGNGDSQDCTIVLQDANVPVCSAADPLTWVDQTSAGARSWSSIASSDDGLKLVAAAFGGDIWTSIDGGDNWTDHTIDPGTNDWISVASSDDGLNLVAAQQSGDIWTSIDGGVNWIDHSGDPGPRNWTAVVSSSSGVQLAAIESTFSGGHIWVSDDSGASWTPETDAGARNWSAITISANGLLLAAADGNDTGDIWTSSDGGDNWTDRAGAGARNWSTIASFNNGLGIIASDSGTGSGGDIWISTDGGANWSDDTSAGTREWFSVTSSTNGTHLAATDVTFGDIWISTDSGTSWTDQTAEGARFWQQITSSGDGSMLAAIDSFGSDGNGGDIWTYPLPDHSCGGGGGGVTLPTVTTQAASSLNKTSATGNGTITDTGGADVTERGFVYGTGLPYSATTTESGTFSTGAFTADIADLTCGTSYTYAAYATNSAGTSYGSNVTFTTDACSTSGGGGGGSNPPTSSPPTVSPIVTNPNPFGPDALIPGLPNTGLPPRQSNTLPLEVFTAVATFLCLVRLCISTKRVR